MSHNQQFGIIAGSSSHLAIFGWDAAAGSTLTASGNGVAGLGFADSSLTTFSNSVITATNNGVGLLLAPGGHVISPPFARATFVLHDNGVGMNLRPGSSAFIVGGLNVHDNDGGVLVDEASLYLEAAHGTARLDRRQRHERPAHVRFPIDDRERHDRDAARLRLDRLEPGNDDVPVALLCLGRV